VILDDANPALTRKPTAAGAQTKDLGSQMQWKSATRTRTFSNDDFRGTEYLAKLAVNHAGYVGSRLGGDRTRPSWPRILSRESLGIGLSFRREGRDMSSI
jgi:hypothetical protein